ncbi:MAG: cardiolipin synthase [Clostridia bacterium]|nr:cardiolipin synthase [Clostridia bacterium]
MKKLSKILLSKSFLFGILFVFQLLIVFAFIAAFQKGSGYAYVVVTIVSLIISLGLVVNDKINPAYKLMWILTIVILPVTGFIFYVIWGNHANSKFRIGYSKVENSVVTQLVGFKNRLDELCDAYPKYARIAKYLANSTGSPVNHDAGSEYFCFGELFYTDLITELQKAQEKIYLEYYIIKNGKMWESILSILQAKARKGVDVRLIYDDFGCILSLPSDYPEKLKKSGIKAYKFNRFRLYSSVSDYRFFNHRNHRKMIIIDDKIAYSGGLNLADEYINEIARFGRWKDNAFKITGNAVCGLSSIFMTDWCFVSGDKPSLPLYESNNLLSTNQGYIQSYGDSPLDYEQTSQNLYVSILNTAEKYVYITSPYLAIDNTMITALTNAAKSGIDVRIILPGIPDKKAVFEVTQSYYKVLLDGGVKIYEYTPGFVHCKTFISDDKIAVIGTANMDFRSLFLHFENGTVFYGGKIIKDVKADMIKTMSDSTQIKKADLQKLSLKKRINQKFVKLFAPLI